MACLQHLYASNLPANYFFDVFLVDDGSTDGTGLAVKAEYPEVRVIAGNGQLYWNKGMHLAWETASNEKDYDFYLWLNDDTFLDVEAINELLVCLALSLNANNPQTIIVGVCKTSFNSNKVSYGGRADLDLLIPNGIIQPCKYINGNLVLVPKLVFKTLGNLSTEYTHGMGDYDYGLRALKQGFNCMITRKIIAVCPVNDGIPMWCNPKVPIRQRFANFHSPNGLNISEYLIFRRKFWGWQWIIFATKSYVKLLFPQLFFNNLK
ncbi:MAG: glycosyltransferase [Salinivirgaceae bacterium]|nr:glycosyltransferase [Salinivirgaceae bacterium]